MDITFAGIHVTQTFRITGAGRLTQTAGGSSAPITVADFSILQFSDPAFLTTGPLTLQDFSGIFYNSASDGTLSKDITLGAGGGQIGIFNNKSLTYSGTLSESSPAQGLAIIYGRLVLTNADTFSGGTSIAAGGVASVATISNGGVAGPLGKPSSAPGTLVISDGAVQYTGAGAATDRGFTILDLLSTLEVTNPGTNLTFSGQVVGSGTLNKSGPGTLTLTNIAYSGATNVSAGKLALAANLTASPTVSVANATLELTSGGGSNRVIKTSAIATTGTGKLDLRDNKLIVTAAGAAGSWNGTAYTGVTGLIRSGKGPGSAWNGTTGIITSMSAAVGSNFTTLGVARASDVKPSTATATALWAGQTITGTNTLVMYTYGGDATLDGKINIDDYIRIDSGISSHLTGWTNGDFNYDGKVNIDDYTQFIDANIGIQGAPFPTASGVSSGGTASAGPDSVTAVPEPTGITISGVGLICLTARRRCRRCT